MKMYITKDEYTKKQKILLMPEIYEQIENNINRTGIVYKHSKFNIRYAAYDKLYDFEEVTIKNAFKYLRQLKMLKAAVNREKEKRKWNGISYKAIFMFYDEFVEMYTRLLTFGDDNVC